MPKQLCPTPEEKKRMDQALEVGNKEVEERKLQIIFKKVKTFKPFCPVCNEMLMGNGSIMFPYWCECGTWKHDDQCRYWTITKDEGGA